MLHKSKRNSIQFFFICLSSILLCIILYISGYCWNKKKQRSCMCYQLTFAIWHISYFIRNFSEINGEKKCFMYKPNAFYSSPTLPKTGYFKCITFLDVFFWRLWWTIFFGQIEYIALYDTFTVLGLVHSVPTRIL